MLIFSLILIFVISMTIFQPVYLDSRNLGSDKTAYMSVLDVCNKAAPFSVSANPQIPCILQNIDSMSIFIGMDYVQLFADDSLNHFILAFQKEYPPEV